MAQDQAGIPERETWSALPYEVENRIEYGMPGLGRFWYKLRQLEASNRKRVTIVHIGDSHIQADWFSGKLRRLLHHRFGAAGRGLVFPYTVAGTNSPPDVRSSSSVDWDARRNVQSQPKLPIGVAGITMQTRSLPLLLSVRLEEEEIDYSFDRVLLFSNKGMGLCDLALCEKINSEAPAPKPIPTVYHTVRSGETLSEIAEEYGIGLSVLKKQNGIRGSTIYAGQRLAVQKGRSKYGVEISYQAAEYRDSDTARLTQPGLEPFLSLLEFQAPQDRMFLRSIGSDQNSQALQIYGLSLERKRASGILYHSIGVNGATFRDYNQSEYFFQQLSSLHPDLIILSLGTNESLEGHFSAQNFDGQVLELLQSLSKAAPMADILLTTPPDGKLNRTNPNPHLIPISAEIKKLALDSRTGLWDFFTIMGGPGAMDNWYAEGFAQKDKLHLNKAGYERMGELLFEALMEGYYTTLSNSERY